ncbi:spore-associated protein A [Streptosporangium canum]|uniref:spore-associated protein A n=1 Tax=Streptosporangium canum TaxID=324952 RepID=UPI003791D7D7
MKLRRMAAAGLITTATLAGGMVTAGPASAASYNGSCGPGYSVSHSVGSTTGTVFLTYNSSNGYNCAVAIANRRYSTAVRMNVWIRLSSNHQKYTSEDGKFHSYAGPVFLYGKNSCIDYRGMIADAGAGASKVACG